MNKYVLYMLCIWLGFIILILIVFFNLISIPILILNPILIDPDLNSDSFPNSDSEFPNNNTL